MSVVKFKPKSVVPRYPSNPGPAMYVPLNDVARGYVVARFLDGNQDLAARLLPHLRGDFLHETGVDTIMPDALVRELQELDLTRFHGELGDLSATRTEEE